jgi:hypothetical protein
MAGLLKPGRQDDQIRAIFIAGCVDDADGVGAFQEHAINFDAALDRKIPAGANAIIEEGDSGVDAAAGNDVERVGTHCGLLSAVAVGDARSLD